MTPAYTKLNEATPGTAFFDGKSGFQGGFYVFFLTELARQRSNDGIVRISENYLELIAWSGVTRVRTIVANLKKLHEAGLVKYTGQDESTGDRLYKVNDAFAVHGSGTFSGYGDNRRVNGRANGAVVNNDSKKDSDLEIQDQHHQTVRLSPRLSPEDLTGPKRRVWEKLEAAYSGDVQTLVNDYGFDEVLEKACWWDSLGDKYKVGYLVEELKKGESAVAPSTYEPRAYMTDEEYYAGGKYADEFANSPPESYASEKYPEVQS